MAESWTNRLKIFVSVKSIKYLVKGGRVSAMRGLIARILNINPIVSIDESGKAFVFDKTLNQKVNMDKVMGYITEMSKERKIWNYIVLHANNRSAAKWYSDKMVRLTGKRPVSVVNISPVLGANAGIGAASVALLFE